MQSRDHKGQYGQQVHAHVANVQEQQRLHSSQAKENAAKPKLFERKIKAWKQGRNG